MIGRLPEKGLKYLNRNHRLISILFMVSEVIEKLANCSILFYLKQSTADLSFVTHIWQQSIELHGETQVMALHI